MAHHPKVLNKCVNKYTNQTFRKLEWFFGDFRVDFSLSWNNILQNHNTYLPFQHPKFLITKSFGKANLIGMRVHTSYRVNSYILDFTSMNVFDYRARQVPRGVLSNIRYMHVATFSKSSKF